LPFIFQLVICQKADPLISSSLSIANWSLPIGH